jgi:CRISPR-associated exonuclease Cas4
VSTLVTFSDLARAAYCPRQLYYARRDDDRGPPPDVADRRALAFRYADLRDATDETLRSLPLAVPPDEYRAALDRLVARDDFDALCDPTDRDVLLTGKDCRGVVHKLLASDRGAPPVPVLVSPGDPPEQGVWEPQTVRAVAAAKALSWVREREIPRAIVEYPTHGVVRTVRLTTRKKAAYRVALRTVRGLDGPPPRLRGSDKCDACDYRDECGVKTRSLRSLLGL